MTKILPDYEWQIPIQESLYNEVSWTEIFEVLDTRGWWVWVEVKDLPALPDVLK